MELYHPESPWFLQKGFKNGSLISKSSTPTQYIRTKSSDSNSHSALNTPLVRPFSKVIVSSISSISNRSPEPPEVTFVLKPDRPIPMHPHIYSNGIICLDLLGSQGWSPVQNVE